MAMPRALSLLTTVDRLMPRSLKRLVRAVLPSAGDHLIRRAARTASATPSRVAIQAGPLTGRPIVCSLRTEVSYFLGTHEPAITALYGTLRPGDRVLDIGGHIGYTALLAAHHVGPSGRVIVFEPHPDNRVRIAENLALNPDLAARITVEPLALSDQIGTARLGGSESTASLGNAGITVSTTTLDAYEAEHGLRPGVVKMDIEGAEVLALPAGELLWADVRPVIAVELHNLDAWHTLTRLASRHGYHVDRWSGEWLPADAWEGRDIYRARPSTAS